MIFRDVCGKGNIIHYLVGVLLWLGSHALYCVEVLLDGVNGSASEPPL